MSLVKSPRMTPAKLAANRANAQKSTGPRTALGKARVALNALKHGRYAVALRDKIICTGDLKADHQYRWLRSEIAHTFHPWDPASRREVEQLANRMWCLWTGPGNFGTKPGSGVLSGGEESRPAFPSQRRPQRYRLVDRWRGVGIVFWIQRRRYWTRKRRFAWLDRAIEAHWEAFLEEREEAIPLPEGAGTVESGWRCRRFEIPEPLGPLVRFEWEAENRRLAALAARRAKRYGAESIIA